MRALAFLLACLCALAHADESSRASAPAWPHIWPKDAAGLKTGGASSDAANDGTRPLFCKGLDCPHFDVVETLPGNVELRRYHGKTRWVATRVRDATFFDAQIIGTKRLIAYFAGWNEERLFLRPTLPLVTALFPADRRSRSVKGTYVLMAYIPEDRQDRPPCPSDPDVHVLTFRGAREFFVQTVDGFLDSNEVVKRGWDLIERLRDEHRCVTRCVFGFSLYDPPTKLLFRHNEIWVPARRRCSRSDAPAGGDSGDQPAGDDDDDGEWDDGAWPEQDSYDGECSAEDIQPDQPPSS